MSLADRLGIAALAVAVVGIAISVYYGRRALRPAKRKLRWSFSAEKLFSQGNEDWRSVIEVRVLDERVGNPYFATLTLTNVGREDISSVLFDQHRAIEFEITGKVATLQPLNFPRAATVEGTRVRFGPELLRAGESWTVRMVTDGKPEVKLRSFYLVATSIDGYSASVETSENAERTRNIQAATISAIATVAAALVGVVTSLLAVRGR